MSCWKMVRKIINIIKGWYYKFFEKNKKLATDRLAICALCKSKVCLEIIGDICDECGCVLDAKVRVKDEKCNLNKW